MRTSVVGSRGPGNATTMRLLLPGHGHRGLSILLYLAASGSAEGGTGIREDDAL